MSSRSRTLLCLPTTPFVSIRASTSESKDWQSLPRPVVECIQVQGLRVVKESGLISKSLVAYIKEKRHFRSREANVDATGLLRLSSEALISVV